MGTSLLTAAQVASLIGNHQADIFVRESVNIQVDIDFPDELLVDDQTDQDSLSHTFGWRAWVEPSQADLDNDLKSPDNIWEPIYGEFSPIQTLTTDYLKKIKSYQESKLTLNNSSVVEKYESIWSDFIQLSDVFIERIFDGSAISRVFSVETDDKTIDTNRLFVYVDGILQPLTNIKISKLTVLS